MRQISRYKIVNELGRGAMGVVYRALDPAISRTVAIKTINLQRLGDDEQHKLRDRLMREAQSAGALSHPNIVTVYDVGEDTGSAYICMEYVEGVSLERFLQDTPPSGETLIKLLREVAAGLDYAHAKGVIHRDIKPANILVQEGRIAKITDFGVAKIQSQQATQAGLIMGTPNYMSPEQIQGHKLDGRSDQFSLAVMVYEAITGEKPFTAEEMPTLLYRIVREDPVPPRRLNATLPVNVDPVLQKALAKQPEDRYATCMDFLRALELACRTPSALRPMSKGGSQILPTLVATPVPIISAADGTPARHVPEPLGTEATVAVPAVKLAPAVEPLPPLPERAEVIGRGRRVSWAVLTILGVCSLFGSLAAFRYVQQQRAQRTVPPVVAQTKPAAPLPLPAPLPAAPTTGDAQPEAGAIEDQPIEPTPLARTPAARGTAVQLVSVPAGAQAVIDNDSALGCVMPCTRSLPNGTHSLSVELEGYRPVLRRFELPSEKELLVELDALTGRLFLRSDPPGAKITINGQPRPERTPAGFTLAAGRYQIEVSKEGVGRKSTEVTIRPEALAELELSFRSGQP